MKCFLTSLLCVVPVVSCVGQRQLQHWSEQRDFNLGLDGPAVKRPVALSTAELNSLAGNQLMRQKLNGDTPVTSIPTGGLEAGVVHLHGSKERDLVVIGSGQPFLGANIGPFWIIRDLPSGPKVVLQTMTLALSVLPTRSKGLRDIELNASTGVDFTTTCLRFDGERYIMLKNRSHPIGK